MVISAKQRCTASDIKDIYVLTITALKPGLVWFESSCKLELTSILEMMYLIVMGTRVSHITHLECGRRHTCILNNANTNWDLWLDWGSPTWVSGYIEFAL